MPIANLPPLNMIAGKAYWQGWQLRNPDETVVDLSLFSAVCDFSRDGEPLLSVTLTITPENNIELNLDPLQVEGLSGPRATYEITITPNTDPSAPPAEVWRGSVNVQ